MHLFLISLLIQDLFALPLHIFPIPDSGKFTKPDHTWQILFSSATSLGCKKDRVDATLMPSGVRLNTSPSLPQRASNSSCSIVKLRQIFRHQHHPPKRLRWARWSTVFSHVGNRSTPLTSSAQRYDSPPYDSTDNR